MQDIIVARTVYLSGLLFAAVALLSCWWPPVHEEAVSMQSDRLFLSPFLHELSSLLGPCQSVFFLQFFDNYEKLLIIIL